MGIEKTTLNIEKMELFKEAVDLWLQEKLKLLLEDCMKSV